MGQGFAEKTRKDSELAKASNISFLPLIFLDTGKAHRAAAKFMKWLCYVAIPGSRCQKNKSVVLIIIDTLISNFFWVLIVTIN